jgi:uncharacterized iron-regulated membrane protein
MLTDKLVFRIHRLLGLTAGLFILMLTLTGSVLVLDSQVDGWLNPGVVTVAPGAARPGAARQPADVLLASARRQYPSATLLNMRLYAGEPDRATRVELKEKGERIWVYVNPYTGAVTGTREREKAFVRRMRELHESLLWEPYGGYIMGLVGLCLLGSVLTGAWYYRKSLLGVFSMGVRWKKSRRIVYADLHKYLGVVALLFMTWMGATGVFFHWEHVERSFGNGPQRPKTEVTPPTITTVDAYLTRSQQAIPQLTPDLIAFPEAPDRPLVVRGNTPESNRMLGRFTAAVEFDALTGAQQKVFRAEEADAEYKLEHVFEELHFGRFGGPVTQILWIVMALATAVVSVTGLLIWWVKR